jgi:hypothetical protein
MRETLSVRVVGLVWVAKKSYPRSVTDSYPYRSAFIPYVPLWLTCGVAMQLAHGVSGDYARSRSPLAARQPGHACMTFVCCSGKARGVNAFGCRDRRPDAREVPHSAIWSGEILQGHRPGGVSIWII